MICCELQHLLLEYYNLYSLLLLLYITMQTAIANSPLIIGLFCGLDIIIIVVCRLHFTVNKDK